MEGGRKKGNARRKERSFGDIIAPFPPPPHSRPWCVAYVMSVIGRLEVGGRRSEVEWFRRFGGREDG